MKLSVGQPAPVFITKDIWGNEFNLAEIKSQKMLITFFRYAECALCNLRISEVVRFQDNLKRNNIKFIAIFQSPDISLRESVASKHQFDFTIISDPDRELYNLYDVKPSWLKLFQTLNIKAIKSVFQAAKLGFKPGGKVEGAFHQIPADFVINENKTIEIAHYGNSVVDHLPLKDIFARGTAASVSPSVGKYQ
jgi:thioredoxin-dependent peroxiredoxin